MRYWPIGLVVFGVALLGIQLWPLWTDIVRLLMLVEVLALGVVVGMAIGERRGG